MQISGQFHGVAGYNADILCDPGRDALGQPLRTYLSPEVGVVQFFAVTLDVLGVLVHCVFGLDY
jgi:hypothetical protein